jgi:integrase
VKITPHTLRHSAITYLSESGADVPTIKEFSGHRSLEMVMRYAHARDKQIDAALDRLEKSKTKPEPIPISNRQSS